MQNAALGMLLELLLMAYDGDRDQMTGNIFGVDHDVLAGIAEATDEKAKRVLERKKTARIREDAPVDPIVDIGAPETLSAFSLEAVTLTSSVTITNDTKGLVHPRTNARLSPREARRILERGGQVHMLVIVDLRGAYNDCLERDEFTFLMSLPPEQFRWIYEAYYAPRQVEANNDISHDFPPRFTPMRKRTSSTTSPTYTRNMQVRSIESIDELRQLPPHIRFQLEIHGRPADIETAYWYLAGLRGVIAVRTLPRRSKSIDYTVEDVGSFLSVVEKTTTASRVA